MKNFKVIYYGMDAKLVEALDKEKVKCVEKTSKVFFEHIKPDENHVLLCDLILENDMDLILIDLSSSTNIDRALRVLLYELHINNVKIIGLWNDLENPNLKNWRFELGINTHFCYWIRDPGSLEDLMLGLARYMGINNDDFTFFAKDIHKAFTLLTPIRINYFSSAGLQIESDISIRDKEIVKCSFPSFPNYPFTDFYVSSITRLNLSYPLENQATLENVFYDKFEQLYRSAFDDFEDLNYLELLSENPVISRNLDELQVKDIITSFNDNKIKSKNKKSILERMVGKMSKFSDLDILKNLIIDPDFSSYKDTLKPIWSYPTKFLLVSTLEDNLNILNTCGAQLVTFVIHEEIDPNEFTETIEFVQLKTIASRLKNNYNSMGISAPLLQIYYIDISATNLNKVLEYENISVSKKKFNFKDHNNFLKDYKETPAFLDEIKFYGHKLDIVSPKSYSEISHGFLERAVNIISMSESELIFNTDILFEINYSFMMKLSDGSSIYATIYKVEENENEFKYFSIVNSLNEKEKQKLRKLLIKG